MRPFLYIVIICFFTVVAHADAIHIKDDQTLSDILNTTYDYKFHVSANALYLKPNNIDTLKDDHSIVEIPVETQFQWGYQIKVDYFFSDNKDIYIEWVHYRNDLPENVLFHQRVSGESETLLHEGYHSNFDIINLDFGQWISLKNGFLLKIHAGVEYANLDVGYHFNYQTTNAPQITHRYLKDYVYHLWGTRMGLNLAFLLNDNLDLVLDATALMLNRSGHHHYSNVASINPGQFLMTDIDVRSKLNGILYGTDIESVVNYKIHLSSSLLVLSGGARGIIFIEDYTKWSGAMFGVKWLGNL